MKFNCETCGGTFEGKNVRKGKIRCKQCVNRDIAIKHSSGFPKEFNCVDCNIVINQNHSNHVRCSKCSCMRSRDKKNTSSRKSRKNKLPLFIKKCLSCEKEIQTHNNTKVYCSETCQTRDHSKKYRARTKNKTFHTKINDKSCILCKKQLIGRRTKFCSRKCDTRFWHIKCKEHKNPKISCTGRTDSICKLNKRIRKQRLKNATPRWANKQELLSWYLNRPKDMHIDHIIPINHNDVCGLNVPWNLQYLNVQENEDKTNSFDGTYENEMWRYLKPSNWDKL